MTSPSPRPQQHPLSVLETIELLEQAVLPLVNPQAVELMRALGRVLAHDIHSPIDVPAYDNAAMDGWALRYADTIGKDWAALEEVGVALAGKPFIGSVYPGACVRIMTGAVMPQHCDTVVPYEMVSSTVQGCITFKASSIKSGANHRKRGEDLQHGAVALQQGRILQAADLGLLASLGIGHVEVNQRLRVALLSSGDELCTPGQALAPGKIYDSNRYALFGMLDRLGCEVIDGGHVADDPQHIERVVRTLAQQADVIMLSGGAAAGDADFTASVFHRLGKVQSLRVALKPGSALNFVTIDIDTSARYVFGLPGNPVAAIVVFHVLVRPALLKMMGARAIDPPCFPARLLQDMKRKSGRVEYLRGIAQQEMDGTMSVRLSGAQGSGVLHSLSRANCFVMLDAQTGELQAGETVQILPFYGVM